MKTKIVTLEDNGLTDNLKVCIYESTGFNPGSIVVHNNEGKYAGSSGIINVGQGTVKEVNYQGLTLFGGHCFTAEVAWSNGETFEVNINALSKRG